MSIQKGSIIRYDEVLDKTVDYIFDNLLHDSTENCNGFNKTESRTENGITLTLKINDITTIQTNNIEKEDLRAKLIAFLQLYGVNQSDNFIETNDIIFYKKMFNFLSAVSIFISKFPLVVCVDEDGTKILKRAYVTANEADETEKTISLADFSKTNNNAIDYISNIAKYVYSYNVNAQEMKSKITYSMSSCSSSSSSCSCSCSSCSSSSSSFIAYMKI